jgi:septal ring factor EnvC (AmiA/AmiB activator)
MKGAKLSRLFLVCGAIGFSAGCLFTSRSNLNEAQTQNRVLSQQNRAQLTEIENLKTHSREVENKLIHSEEEIASLKNQADFNRRQLADYESENAKLFEQFKALARARARTAQDANSYQNSGLDTNTVR